MTRITRWFKHYWFELVLVLPMTAYILGFTIVPIMRTIIMGFQDPLTGKFSFSTYIALFNKPAFMQSIFNTFFIAIIELVIQLILAFWIALILEQKFRGRGLIRSLVLMPMGVPTLVSGVIAMYIFGTSGYLNELLYRFGLKIPIQWLAGGMRALFVVAVADTWKVLPTMVLLLLAGLESIPRDIYEAASIDGADKRYTFWHITIPIVMPTITMAVLMRAVDVFRIFELPQVLVGTSTPFVATFAYQEYSNNNLNSSGAASTVLLGMILLFTFLWIKFVDKGRGLGIAN